MSRRPLPPFWHFIAAVAVLFARGIMGWRIDIRGVEHVPREGGGILAFNHHSYFDFVMAAWAVVIDIRRPVRFLAKREIWETWKLRWLVQLAGAVPVDRTSPGSRHRAFDAAIGALRDGELVAVAPEQTISSSFELLPFRTGAARMAQGAGVPIIPVVGWGTQRFATKGRRPRLARGIPVVVEYGAPLRVGPDDDPMEATEELQRRMGAMLDRVQRGYPDRPTPGDDWWAPAHLGGTAPSHDEVLAEHLAREQAWREPDQHGDGREMGGPESGPHRTTGG